MKRKPLFLLTLFACLPMVSSCSANTENNSAIDSSMVGIYSLDLNVVGMALTIYLNLKDDATFLFSNTTRFETIKSEGTYQKNENEYLMVYTGVNGESKTTSDGLVSNFIYDGNDTLTFTSPYIYYGSTSHVTTKNADDASKILKAKKMTDISSGEETAKSEFTTGYYEGSTTVDDIEYSHHATFFEDETYLDFVIAEGFYYTETGKYYLNGNQIAIESKDPVSLGERIGGSVSSSSSFTLSMVSSMDATKDKRKDIVFTKSNSEKTILFSFVGVQDETQATLTIYSNLSYQAKVNDTIENGYLSFRNTTTNEKSPAFKLYPDSSKGSGLSYVTAIPEGSVSKEGDKYVLNNVSLKNNSRRMTFKTMEEN